MKRWLKFVKILIRPPSELYAFLHLGTVTKEHFLVSVIIILSSSGPSLPFEFPCSSLLLPTSQHILDSKSVGLHFDGCTHWLTTTLHTCRRCTFRTPHKKASRGREMLEAEMLEQGAEKVSDSLLLGSFRDNTTVHAGHTLLLPHWVL